MDGFEHHSAYLNKAEQRALLQDILNVLKASPFYRPTMPKSGRPFSVMETNCGPLGWVSDKQGYRYQPTHPETGNPWPDMPNSLLTIWQKVSNFAAPPEAGLINYYQNTAKMGLHQDKDEQDLTAPVVSISLGNSAKFRLGGLNRRDKTTTLELKSGDVVVLAGNARLCYHGIDRIIPNTSCLLQKDPELQEGRLNITLRRVTKPQ